jgi:hypothetical protein
VTHLFLSFGYALGQKGKDMTTYTAQQAGEAKALHVIKLEDDSSQATLSTYYAYKPRLSMKWQVTTKGLRAVWRKGFSDNL